MGDITSNVRAQAEGFQVGDRVRFYAGTCTGRILRIGDRMYRDQFRVDYDLHCWSPGMGTRHQWVSKDDCERIIDEPSTACRCSREVLPSSCGSLEHPDAH